MFFKDFKTFWAWNWKASDSVTIQLGNRKGRDVIPLPISWSCGWNKQECYEWQRYARCNLWWNLYSVCTGCVFSFGRDFFFWNDHTFRHCICVAFGWNCWNCKSEQGIKVLLKTRQGSLASFFACKINKNSYKFAIFAKYFL